MLVAAITELSIANDANVPDVQNVIGTGAITGLMFAVGVDRYNQLSEHYQRMYQDSTKHELCNALDVEEPEFDLADIAKSSDTLHMFVSERLTIDEFIAREAENAPDVVIVAGEFLNEVDDWERQILSHCPKTNYPDRIEIVTRVVQQAMSDGMTVVTFNAAHDGFPPILLAVAAGRSTWLHTAYTDRTVMF